MATFDEIQVATSPEIRRLLTLRFCKYELGGYPVLKKWLGYRQSNRRDGKPLRTEERRWFRSIVQRIAAILALSREIDGLYSAASENAFTASELKIVR